MLLRQVSVTRFLFVFYQCSFAGASTLTGARTQGNETMCQGPVTPTFQGRCGDSCVDNVSHKVVGNSDVNTARFRRAFSTLTMCLKGELG